MSGKACKSEVVETRKTFALGGGRVVREVGEEGVRSWAIGSLVKGWSSTGDAGRAMFAGEHGEDEKTALVGDAGELGNGVVIDVSRE